MAISITLTAAVRQNLLSLQQTADALSQVQNRLATGKKVNAAVDNPVNFFTAQGLSNRANDLSSLLDSMSNAISTIQAADSGISAITKLVQSAQSLVSQAKQTTDTTTRATLATQFNTLRTQITQLAGDSGFNGVNLLAGNSLTVKMNPAGSSTVTITGYNDTDLSNGAITLAAAANNWAADADIDAAGTQLTTALSKLRDQAQALGSSLSTVQIRQEFTKAMINTLNIGADALTLADANEESANMLALQTRQQLSITALSLASQSNQAVLRLFA
jgi:flagellin-like hook-associated protein FlgL